MNNNNYYSIQGWQIRLAKETNLIDKSTLNYFAIIYGFSQIDGQYFTGSLQYLADLTLSSKKTVQNALKKLVDNNIIIKENIDGKIKYKANLELLDDFNNKTYQPPLKEEKQGVTVSCSEIPNSSSEIPTNSSELVETCYAYKHRVEEKFGVKIKKINLNRWCKDLRLCMQEQGENLVKEVLNWYYSNMNSNKYIPIAQSMSSFREKFIKIKLAMDRANGNNIKDKINSFDPSQGIF